MSDDTEVEHDNTGDTAGVVVSPSQAVSFRERTELVPPKWDEAKQRATTATALAISLTIILALVLFGCFVVAVWISADAAKDVGGLTVPPVATLVGSALGYYFGTHDQARR